MAEKRQTVQISSAENMRPDIQKPDSIDFAGISFGLKAEHSTIPADRSATFLVSLCSREEMLVVRMSVLYAGCA